MQSEQYRPVYRTYVLLLLLALNSVAHADRHLFSILIPQLKSEFLVSDMLLGLIGGPGFTISFILFSLPLARLADRWSRRGALALSATLWSIATAASGLAASIVQLAASRFVVGIGEAGGLPPSQAILADLYGEKRRAGAMGVLTSAAYFGLIIGLFGGAAIAAHWGWRASFLILALPGFPLALLLWLTGPRRDRSTASGAEQQGLSLWEFMRVFWAIRSLRLLGIGIGIFCIFIYGSAVWTPTFFMRSHGLSAVETGAWLGIGAALGGIAGSMGGGVLVDHLRQRGEHWQLRLTAIAFLLSFPLSIAMFLVPRGSFLSIGDIHIPVVGPISVANSMVTAVWAASTYSTAARLVRPDQRAQATAMLVVMITLIGSVTGPTLSGYLSDLLSLRFGQDSLRASLFVLSFFSLAGALIVWRASVHFPRDLAAAETLPPLKGGPALSSSPGR